MDPASGDRWSDLSVFQQIGLVLFLAADQALLVLIPIAAITVLLDWRAGGYVLVAGIAVRLLGHLARGVSAYRAVMARPWPAVPPLPDDDDFWP